MTEQIAIYFAGSIQKGHEQNDSFWTPDDLAYLTHALAPSAVALLNPAVRTDDLSDQKSVFGRDMTQVYSADIVFVDARHRRGLGVGAEMMWAKLHKIPVITLCPRNSHYRKDITPILGVSVSDWVHPFVESLSDALVHDLPESIPLIRAFVSGTRTPKGLEYIEAAMHHYRVTQLPQDTPMQQLFQAHPSIASRTDPFDLLATLQQNYELSSS